MKTCRKCGVRVEEHVDECPLCGEPVSQRRREEIREEERSQSVLEPGNSVDTQSAKTVRSAKIWLFEMLSLVTFTAAIVIFAADFAFGFALEWSVVPLLAIGFFYLAMSAIIGLHRLPIALLVAETAVVAGFLLILDVVLPEATWFLSIALPVTLLVALFSGAAATAIARLRLNALQAVAVAFLASGFFVVGLEFVLNVALFGEPIVSWSLVAFACTLSVFALILFINRRLRERHDEFRKVFHL